jgi:hypothetical protein
MRRSCDNPDCSEEILHVHDIPSGGRAFCSATCREEFLLWVRAAELAGYVQTVEFAVRRTSTLPLSREFADGVCRATARVG